MTKQYKKHMKLHSCDLEATQTLIQKKYVERGKNGSSLMVFVSQ